MRYIGNIFWFFQDHVLSTPGWLYALPLLVCAVQFRAQRLRLQSVCYSVKGLRLRKVDKCSRLLLQVDGNVMEEERLCRLSRVHHDHCAGCALTMQIQQLAKPLCKQDLKKGLCPQSAYRVRQVAQNRSISVTGMHCRKYEGR